MISCFFPPKILFVSGVVWFSLFVVIKSEDYQAPLSDCELEKLLKPILSPPDDRTIQAQALRQRLLNLLRQAVVNEQVDNGIDEKRSISSLARWNSLPNKRNVQSLARSGLLSSQRYDNEEDQNDPNLKRNFFYYHDNKQQNYNDNNKDQRQENKRGIQSLARNGELPHQTRQQIEDLIEELYEKRNIGSLARDYNFPSYGKRFVGSLARNGNLKTFNPYKRNIASIVRNGRSGPEFDEFKRSLASLARSGDIMGKRNVAALLRQDSYLNKKHENGDEENETETEAETDAPGNEDEINRREESKRNLASIKASYKPKFKREAKFETRSKRQVDYYDELNDEYLQPVYQNSNSLNYDDLINELNDAYPTADKRFLGSVARSGWPSSLVRFNSPDKRHIGSLARLGWLPSLRSIRRFNRSGRSTNYEDFDVCRPTSSNGKIENNPYTKNTENSKRLLLIPTVDKLRLRRFPMAPRVY